MNKTKFSERVRWPNNILPKNFPRVTFRSVVVVVVVVVVSGAVFFLNYNQATLAKTANEMSSQRTTTRFHIHQMDFAKKNQKLQRK